MMPQHRESLLPLFEYQRAEENEISILRLRGSLTALTALELKGVITALVQERRLQVIVDLSSLEVIDSSGVGALVSLFKRIRSLHGDVKITGLTGQPLEIFRLLNLDKAFDIAVNQQEAVDKFSQLWGNRRAARGYSAG